MNAAILPTEIVEDVGLYNRRVLALMASELRVAEATEHSYKGAATLGHGDTFWVVGITGLAMSAAQLPFVPSFAIDGEEHARKALALIGTLYTRLAVAS
ncbi:hypothetical protein EUA02_26845 [Mycobacterium paragordonae]|uniref:hypothetical protein n=1 Tax=Mycobacterium paragordonae TaxID=1389713 RepID=UPI00105E26E0|nr:hypothetical protein [Mycobacterium paragordonae]TDK87547.1 hypothetical protein EUA02_26845 [Mycobacterium paragordonae]TDL01122.1 hypothetical protein EUA05_28610 [Mycobacterium paragordonae]